MRRYILIGKNKVGDKIFWDKKEKMVLKSKGPIKRNGKISMPLFLGGNLWRLRKN